MGTPFAGLDLVCSYSLYIRVPLFSPIKHLIHARLFCRLSRLEGIPYYKLCSIFACVLPVEEKKCYFAPLCLYICEKYDNKCSSEITVALSLPNLPCDLPPGQCIHHAFAVERSSLPSEPSCPGLFIACYCNAIATADVLLHCCNAL